MIVDGKYTQFYYYNKGENVKKNAIVGYIFQKYNVLKWKYNTCFFKHMSLFLAFNP